MIVVTHNPDVFPEIPSRVTLTIAGHTWRAGGSAGIRTACRAVSIGERYAIGHIVEQGGICL